MRQQARTVWSIALILALFLTLIPAAFADEAAAPEIPAAEETEEPAAEKESTPAAEKETPAQPEAAAPAPQKQRIKSKRTDDDVLDLDEEALTEDEMATCLWIEDFLRVKMELNDAAIAAILASIHRESRFDATLVGDNGTAYGLFQWHGVRRDRLFEYCRKHRLDYQSVKGQMFFFRAEVNEYFGDLEKHILRKCVDSEKGALWVSGYFCEGFEAPSDMERNLSERAELTRRAFYPLVKTGIWPEEDPDWRPSAKPAAKPVEQPAEQPAEQEAEQPGEQSAEPPLEQPVEQPGEPETEAPELTEGQSLEQPGEDLSETPAA